MILAASLLTLSAHADGLLTTHRMSLELASEVVASCGKQGYAETAVVVDADGVRQAVLRGDRAGSHTLDSANDKAYTAASHRSRPRPAPSWRGPRPPLGSLPCSRSFRISS